MSGSLSESRAMEAITGGSPILLGLAAELSGHTLHAEICRAVLIARKGAGDPRKRTDYDIACDDQHGEACPHPEINISHPEAGTVLHWAVAQHLNEAALALLACEHFTLVNARRDSDGSTALHIAAAERLNEVVAAMLAHPDFIAVSGIDRDGFSALHGAAYRGNVRGAQLILEHPGFGAAVGTIGAFDVLRPSGHWAAEAAADYDMRTALHMAAAGGHAEICDAILSRVPPSMVSADAQNRVGATALHMAARGGHTAACRAILASTAFAAVNIRDARGFTALHYAAQQASGDICAALLAREDFTALETRDLRGRTGMDIAAELGYHEIRRLIIARLGPEALRAGS